MSCRNCDCAKCRAANEQPDIVIRGPIGQPFLVPFAQVVCTCHINGWWSVDPPPPCPMHGRSIGTVITYSTATTGAPQ